MSTTSPLFTAGGLASGLDTNSIVDKLVALESAPIAKNTTRQAALNVQVSSLGDLLSKIKSLASTATTLGSGVTANAVATTPAGVSAVAGTGATPGRYSITVTATAAAAKARSTTFASPNDTVAGGNLTLHVQGVATTIAITPNSDLGSVVKQIYAAGQPIRAAVVSDGTNFYVSLTNRDTGKPIGSAANGGLTVDGDPTGLGLAVTQDANNALLTVDGLPIESKSNDISTAIPGVTLSARAQQLVASDLVINADSTKSTGNLQGFVDSFNAIMKVLKQSLRPDPNAPPADGTTLDGSLALGLQRALHGLLSTKVINTGGYRTLADIGVKLQSDGLATLDGAVTTKAFANDPGGVDAIFSTASTGMAAKITALSKTFTDPVNGQLIQRQSSLNRTIKDLQTSNVRLQSHVDSYKLLLQRQFATMETLISNYNSIGTFLNNSSAVQAASKK